MMEWTVVTVLTALVGLLAALLKPLLSLHGAITRLASSVENLENQIEDLVRRNNEAHSRLWHKCDEQDALLHNHETRLQIMESSRAKA